MHAVTKDITSQAVGETSSDTRNMPGTFQTPGANLSAQAGEWGAFHAQSRDMAAGVFSRDRFSIPSQLQLPQAWEGDHLPCCSGKKLPWGDTGQDHEQNTHIKNFQKPALGLFWGVMFKEGSKTGRQSCKDPIFPASWGDARWWWHTCLD